MSRRQTKNTGSTTRDVNAAIRAQSALKLSAQGYSWDEIAAKSGFASRGAAHNAVMRELDRNISRDVNELRARELHMLNTMQIEIWYLVMDRTNTWRLTAADRLLVISERRARLMGLDVKADED